MVGLRLVTGVGEAAMWVGAATAIQDMAPPDRRGEAASYFSVALYGGMAFGPFAGEWLMKAASFDTVWIAAGCSALVASVLGLWTPQRIAAERQPFRLLHPAGLGPGFVLLLGLIPFTGFSTFISLYGPEVSIDDVAPLFLVYGCLVLVIRIFGATLPDRLGWKLSSTIALTMLGAAALMLAAWGAAPGVWIAMVGFAAGMSLLFPALFTAAVASAPEHERSQAVGTFSLFFDLAGGIAPPLLGVVVSLGSYRLAFAVAGLCALAGLVAVSRLEVTEVATD